MSTQTSAYQPPWSTITIMWFARGADYAAYEMVHTKIANFGSFVPNRLQCDLYQKLIISRSNFQCLLSIFQRSINWFLKCTAYKNWLHTDMTEYTISRCPTEMWHAISNHSCIIHAYRQSWSVEARQTTMLVDRYRCTDSRREETKV